MVTVNRSIEVPHSAANMFDLVNDILSYPNFLPWCSDAQILEQTPDDIKAKISLAFGGISKSFTTINRLQPHKMINMSLVDGPFHHLEGFWRFEDLTPEAGEELSTALKMCKVSLDLEYEFANKLVSFAIGPAFNKIANSLIDAFCARADNVYANKR